MFALTCRALFLTVPSPFVWEWMCAEIRKPHRAVRESKGAEWRKGVTRKWEGRVASVQGAKEIRRDGWVVEINKN